MSNTKYTQVMSLLAAGRLNWSADMIQAVLVKDATFDAADKVLSDVGTAFRTVPITGRLVYGRSFLGDAVFFPDVEADQVYQVIIVQNLGTQDPNVLGWYDITLDDQEILVTTPGTLVVRPAVVADDGTGPPPSDTARIWMQV